MAVEIALAEIRHWIAAFLTEPVRALYYVPNETFSVLRSKGYLDASCDVTQTGLDLMGE